jgi:hypothetical protein
MPYKIITPELKEKQRLRHKEWSEKNKEYLKLYNSFTTRNRSLESKENERLRMKRSYEKVKERRIEYAIFKENMPLFLTV